MNKTFDVHRELEGGRALVRGEFRDLYPGDTVRIYSRGRLFNARVETRVSNGAVVRVLDRAD